MSKYDKELDTRTDEYEEAIEPLERDTTRNDEGRDGSGKETEEQKEENP